MRIAITFQRVDPSKGGAETYVADLLRRLVAAGQEVTLFANEWNADALPREVRCLNVEAPGWTRSSRIRNFAKNSEIAMKADPHECSIGFINTWHQDILIPQGGVHEASLEANAQRFPAGWRRDLYVASKRINPKCDLYRAIEREQYDPIRKTRFVAVSRMVARDLERFHKVPADRVRVIPNAIDASRLDVANREAARAKVRARHGLADTDLVGLFVAHNFRLKGLPPLLEAIAERIRLDASRRAIHLFVCGGGKIAPMRRIVERLGLANVIHLVGFAPSVRDYYHASDFFVLPSYYDPCSLVVFEALACGLPVITTACNGAGEVLTQGREGFVVPRPDDEPAMIAALDAMSDDRTRCAMSARAVQLGRAQSFDRHVERLLELCTDVEKQKRSKRQDAKTPRRRGMIEERIRER
jgi:UDP-glucose:(heptosyl)LPS alpha-1,3-glucosyltransferase